MSEKAVRRDAGIRVLLAKRNISLPATDLTGDTEGESPGVV